MAAAKQWGGCVGARAREGEQAREGTGGCGLRAPACLHRRAAVQKRACMRSGCRFGRAARVGVCTRCGGGGGAAERRGIDEWWGLPGRGW